MAKLARLPLSRMHRHLTTDLNTLFDEMNRLSAPFLVSSQSEPQSFPSTWSPPIDVIETENAYEVRLAVAGYTAEMIQLEVEQNRLSVTGQTHSESDSDTTDDTADSKPSEVPSRYLKREIANRQFIRQITFPKDLNADEASARFEHGILTVSLPKHQQTQKKLIQIQ